MVLKFGNLSLLWPFKNQAGYANRPSSTSSTSASSKDASAKSCPSNYFPEDHEHSDKEDTTNPSLAKNRDREKDKLRRERRLSKSKKSKECISSSSKNEFIREELSGISLVLCEEILIRIFSMLPAEYLVRTVPLVCKQWARLTRDEFLWKTLYFQTFRTEERKLLHPHMYDQTCIDNIDLYTLLPSGWLPQSSCMLTQIPPSNEVSSSSSSASSSSSSSSASSSISASPAEALRWKTTYMMLYPSYCRAKDERGRMGLIRWAAQRGFQNLITDSLRLSREEGILLCKEVCAECMKRHREAKSAAVSSGCSMTLANVAAAASPFTAQILPTAAIPGLPGSGAFSAGEAAGDLSQRREASVGGSLAAGLDDNASHWRVSEEEIRGIANQGGETVTAGSNSSNSAYLFSRSAMFANTARNAECVQELLTYMHVFSNDMDVQVEAGEALDEIIRRPLDLVKQAPAFWAHKVTKPWHPQMATNVIYCCNVAFREKAVDHVFEMLKKFGKEYQDVGTSILEVLGYYADCAKQIVKQLDALPTMELADFILRNDTISKYLLIGLFTHEENNSQIVDQVCHLMVRLAKAVDVEHRITPQEFTNFLCTTMHNAEFDSVAGAFRVVRSVLELGQNPNFSPLQRSTQHQQQQQDGDSSSSSSSSSNLVRFNLTRHGRQQESTAVPQSPTLIRRYSSSSASTSSSSYVNSSARTSHRSRSVSSSAILSYPDNIYAAHSNQLDQPNPHFHPSLERINTLFDSMSRSLVVFKKYPRYTRAMIEGILDLYQDCPMVRPKLQSLVRADLDWVMQYVALRNRRMGPTISQRWHSLVQDAMGIFGDEERAAAPQPYNYGANPWDREE